MYISNIYTTIIIIYINRYSISIYSNKYIYTLCIIIPIFFIHINRGLCAWGMRYLNRGGSCQVKYAHKCFFAI